MQQNLPKVLVYKLDENNIEVAKQSNLGLSISKNIENLEKIQFKCGREQGRKVSCETIDGKITLSRRGRSTTEINISPIFFDIYPEDNMPILLDAVIETIGETDYEMKSISGVVFIFSLSDRSFVLSLAGLIIKNLNN